MIKRTLLGGAMAAAVMAGGAALAADPPMAPMPLELPPAPVMYDPWTGFYVGAHIGYGWGDHDFSAVPATGAAETAWGWGGGMLFGEIPTSLSVDSKGILGGIQGGYNHRWDSLLLGLEADFSWAGIKGRTDLRRGDEPILTIGDNPELDFGASAHVDWLATLRARIGLLATEDLLIYGTGGLAFGGVRYSYGFSTVDHALNLIDGGVYGSTSKTKTGWTLGAGLEWAFDENWSVKAEYLYYDLGSTTFATSGFGDASGSAGVFSVKADTKLHTARIGINYRFGHASPQPVIAKY